jgi:hypothetical protein
MRAHALIFMIAGWATTLQSDADPTPRADRQCLKRVCAVAKRILQCGASPTCQPLQSEATGAAVEATKELKHSEGVELVTARVQAVTRIGGLFPRSDEGS